MDRARLSAAVLGRPEALRRLEAIIHPLVRSEEEAFLKRCREAGAGLAVLDVPLLLETGGESRCDAVLVVTAPPEVQRAARAGACGDHGGQVRGAPRAADARCAEAPPRPFPGRHLARPAGCAAAGRVDPDRARRPARARATKRGRARCVRSVSALTGMGPPRHPGRAAKPRSSGSSRTAEFSVETGTDRAVASLQAKRLAGDNPSN